jgi:MFS family permease
MERVSDKAPARPASWKWWICGLLLLASAINYMDRQTLANAAVRITTQFHLNQEQYGNLEWVFGWAFAAGSVLFGVMADRWSVRWVYPVVLVLWLASVRHRPGAELQRALGLPHAVAEACIGLARSKQRNDRSNLKIAPGQWSLQRGIEARLLPAGHARHDDRAGAAGGGLS